MWKVSETGDDSIFVHGDWLVGWLQRPTTDIIRHIFCCSTRSILQLCSVTKLLFSVLHYHCSRGYCCGVTD